jgi:hypothetical protein
MYDRSLEEVWEWKEQVYQQIKGFTHAEYIEKVGRDARAVLNEHGVKLRLVQRANMRFVYADTVTCSEESVEYEGKR